MLIGKLMVTLAWVAAATLALPACKSGAQKAGGTTGSTAKSKGQQGGAQATGSRDQASDQGAERDGLVCDESSDGVGWCESDSEVVFCAEGSWWLLDCAVVEEGAYCGYDDAANEVDCYVE